MFLLAIAVAVAAVPIPAQLCFDPDTNQIAYCYYTHGMEFTRAQLVVPAGAAIDPSKWVPELVFKSLFMVGVILVVYALFKHK